MNDKSASAKLLKPFLVFHGLCPSRVREYQKKSPGRVVRICLDRFQTYEAAIDSAYKDIHTHGWNPPEDQKHILIKRVPITSDDLLHVTDSKLPYAVVMTTFDKYPWNSESTGERLAHYEIEKCSKDSIEMIARKMIEESIEGYYDGSLEKDVETPEIIVGVELKVDELVKKVHLERRQKYIDSRLRKILGERK